MAPVFISYRSVDRIFAMRLAQSLKDAGHDVWIDQWRITGRDPYWYEIQNGIQACTHFIFVITPDSISRAGNNGALKELFHAVGLQQPPILVPVVGKETPYNQLPMVITPGMYQIHNFVLRPYDDALQSVLTALDSKTITQSQPIIRENSQPSAIIWQRRPGTKSLVVLIPIILVLIVAAGFLLSSRSGSPPSTPTGFPTELYTGEAVRNPIVVGAVSTETAAAQPSATEREASTQAAATTALPSATLIPPSATLVPPSPTPVPTATVVPSATLVPPSLTPIPTVTLIPPSLTPIPPSPTPIPTATINFQATQDARATQEWSQVLGQYQVDGRYADGSAYSGTVVISRKGQAYRLDYNVQGAVTTAVGVKMDGFLAVGYGAKCGVLLSKIQPDQSLSGLFAYADISGTEIDRPSSSIGNLAGTYQSSVTVNGQAGSQPFTLTVTDQSSGHYFSWSNGSRGFNVQNGSMIAVAYGGENALPQCGVLLYRIQPDGSLLGQYNYGNGTIGTEDDYRSS